MLKTSARSYEGHVVFARISNAQQRAFQTFVWTSRTAKQSVIPLKPIHPVGGQPDCIHLCAEDVGGVGESLVGANVRGVLCVEIADDADLDCICNEGRIEKSARRLSSGTDRERIQSVRQLFRPRYIWRMASRYPYRFRVQSLARSRFPPIRVDGSVVAARYV